VIPLISTYRSIRFLIVYRGLLGLSMLLLAAIMLSLAGCHYPTDIEHSLDKIKGGVIEVGLTENPPWVIRTPDGPAGLEPEIIERLAGQLNAEAHWHWGEESDLLQALKERQLDLVAGGLTQKAHLSKDAAPTKPYYKSHYMVGFPSSIAMPDSLEDQAIAINAVNHIGKVLRDKGARPNLKTDAKSLAGTDGPVAEQAWWLRAHGFEPGPWTLASDKHVMALPKGENAWMIVLQRQLNSYPDIERRLQQLEANE